MDDTALMIRLLKRLKVEMNGAVTGAMQERGIVYPLNYGVSVPTIRGIARKYGPSHSLALLLYRQQVRELKLSALFVEDPACVTSEQVREWSRDFTHSEIVELTVMYLFSRSAAAVDLIGEWLSADDVFLRYAGVMMLMRTAGGPLCDGERTLFARGGRCDADASRPRTVDCAGNGQCIVSLCDAFRQVAGRNYASHRPLRLFCKSPVARTGI